MTTISKELVKLVQKYNPILDKQERRSLLMASGLLQKSEMKLCDESDIDEIVQSGIETCENCVHYMNTSDNNPCGNCIYKATNNFELNLKVDTSSVEDIESIVIMLGNVKLLCKNEDREKIDLAIEMLEEVA